MTTGSDYLSDNAHVSSWAQSEILYRQQLAHTSNIVEKKTTPAIQGRRELIQKVNDKTPPTKTLSAYTNNKIFAENNFHVSYTKKDSSKHPAQLSASIAAAAYNAASLKANAILPQNEN